MPRARNIKPGFFMNEELAECDLAARLVFIGLWSLADREGRLEDRPKRIRAFVFPYEDYDVDELLNQLQEHGFIIRYKVEGNKYIQVVNFKKHQRPHPKEAASQIPAPPEFSDDNVQPIDDDQYDEEPCLDDDQEVNDNDNNIESREKVIPSREKDVTSNGNSRTSPSDILNPDILNPDILNPDILNPDNKTHAQAHASASVKKAQRTKFVKDLFENQFWKLYPRKRAKQDALKAFMTLFPPSASKEQCNRRWKNIVLHIDALVAEGRPPDKIPYPATFLRRENFDEPPAEMTTSDVPEMEFVEVGSENGD